VTPLERLIRQLIESEGPMRLDHYMGLVLGHPRHGYYMTRDPFGAAGDFITAPEVSQVFGELIGIWCAAAFEAMGRPAAFNLVELGPGRGTLMADILRATKVLPAFVEAATVHFVETSAGLRAVQREKVVAASWHDSLGQVPEGPMILVANEFFDAIPIRQFECRGGQWYERVIGLDGGGLQPGLVSAGDPVQQRPPGRDGDVIEYAPARAEIARAIGQRLAARGGAALIIDYGHGQSAPGDTLQAMKAHRFEKITAAPGECDLTSHVDFEVLGKALAQGGALVPPLLTQREFLLAMGVEARFAALAAKTDAATRGVLARAKSRLADQQQMGNLFKVLAAVSPNLPVLYPFGRP
jgi:NADH dehydrogenase [ubiquinone] 1 alpha subcomplex assembly factor 7